MFSILIVYITLLNAIILIALFIKKNKKTESNIRSENFISVIVAFRNESHNLPILINSLKNQIYPAEKFEVILVDDYSEDDSFQIAKQLISDNSNFKLFKNQYNSGKKNALKTGIEQVQNELLLFTDADCIPKPTWINSVSAAFDSNTDLIYGYSPFLTENSFLNQLCRYENLFTSILMTAFHNVGYPYLSFGRNLGYRKSLFERLGGFEQIQKSLSGDDDLFFQLAIKNQANVKLIDNPESIVLTKCPSNWKTYLRQKSRHISASKFYPLELKFVLSLIYGGNILLQFILPVALITFDPFLLSFIFFNWIIKVLSISKICSTIKNSYEFYLIPVIDFIYNFFLIVTGIRSRVKVASWK
ncbi:MAG: glycosyltransferase [Ignavibacteria bacterium]